MKTKLVLTSLVTVLCSTVFSKTLTCPVFVVEATSKTLDESDLTKKQKNLIVKLDSNGNSINDGAEVEIITTAGEKIKIAALVHSDEQIKALRQVNLAVFVNDKRDSIRSLLLREDGISTGSGWHLGPEGATQLKLMAVNSLSEKSVDMRINSDVIKILRAKQYVTPIQPAQIDSELFTIAEIGQKAVKAGDLKDGSALGSSLVFGCWEEK